LDPFKVVEDLKKRGVVLQLLDLGGDILGNGLSKLFLTIVAAFAEAARDRIRERIGQVKPGQQARVRYLGGKVPFGFRRRYDGELIALLADSLGDSQMASMAIHMWTSPCRPPDTELRTQLCDLANARRRFGYRRLFILLRQDGT
jgi:putative DNA-invertase from lambdoid prophage Rac